MYNLCGVGQKCSIAEGQPSEERARLLRREALELALYTFKYVDDVDSVITLLPVNLGDPSDGGGRHEHGALPGEEELLRQLQAPLDRTLTGAAEAEARPGRGPDGRLAHAPESLPVRHPADAGPERDPPADPRSVRVTAGPAGGARAREGAARHALLLPPARSAPSGCGSRSRRGSSACPACAATTATRSYGRSCSAAPTRPTTSSRTSSATSGRCSTGRCTWCSPI